MQPAQSSYRQLFRNKNFNRLFLARIVSLFGDWFNTLAILALLRAMGDDSAGAFAWILIFKTLPTLFISPTAGAIADRFSRRSIMIISDLGNFFVVSAMLGQMIYPNLNILYVLVVLQSCLSALFHPARLAMLPDVVAENELTAANAISAASWSTMLTVGAALGGLVTDYFGWQVALAVDALSYLVSILFLLKMSVKERHLASMEQSSALKNLSPAKGLSDILEGLRYLKNRPRILSLAMVKSGYGIGGGGILLLLTLFGERVYNIGLSGMMGVGILYTARGLGTGLGPILSRWLSRSDTRLMEGSIGPSFLCMLVFYGLFSVCTSFPLAALCITLAHLGGATLWVFSTVRLQQLVPNTILGRVFATENALQTSMLAASTYVFAYTVDNEILSLRATASMIPLSLLIPLLLWMLRTRKFGLAGDAAIAEAKL